MPSKTTLKLARHIQSLEKKALKFKQQLLKAHVTKINKLEKSAKSIESKLKKAKEKRRSLTGKKTTSAQRQRQSLDSTTIDLSSSLKVAKDELVQAKQAYTQARELEKAVLKAKTELAKSKTKKTALKKKTVKKVLKKAEKTTALTPDLSKPVTSKKAKKKPKKNWQPEKKQKTKVETKPEKITTEEVNKETTVKQQPLPLPAVEEKIVPVVSPRVTEEADNAIPTKEEEKPQSKPGTEKTADTESSSTIVEKNWHTMPILRKHDD